MAPISSLTGYDYTVFGVVLLISAGIGLYYYLTGGRQRTTKEYLLGNNEIGVTTVAISLMASFVSAITLIGVPAENYYFSTQFFLVNFSYLLGTPIAAYVFLPVFFQMKCISSYEYLEHRFDSSVRTAASIVFLTQMILYMGIVLYAPALALSAVTNISKWWSIIIVGLVCSLYCTTGGIKAVLTTDVFQSALMFIVMVAIVTKGTWDAGGIDVVWQRAINGSRVQFLNLTLDLTTRHTVWNLVFGGVFVYLSLYAVNQTQVQRCLTARSLKNAQRALFWSWPACFILSLVTSCCGIVMYAYFFHCDPIQAGVVQKQDQLLPLFAMKILSVVPGMPGLFVAGIFSGALSSVSSFVNSLAAVTLEDYVKPIFYKTTPMSETRAAFTCKVLACFYGVICLVVAYMADKVSGILQASLSIFGVVGGPLLALYTLGMCTKYCTGRAALISFIVSLVFGLWMSFGALRYGPKPQPLPVLVDQCPTIKINTTSSVGSVNDDVFYIYRISYMWYGALTWFLSVAVATLISLIFQRNHSKDVKSELLSPLYHCLFREDVVNVELNDVKHTTSC